MAGSDRRSTPAGASTRLLMHPKRRRRQTAFSAELVRRTQSTGAMMFCSVLHQPERLRVCVSVKLYPPEETKCRTWRVAGAGKHAAGSVAAQRAGEASVGARQAAGGQAAAAAPNDFAPLSARGYEQLSQPSAASRTRSDGAFQPLL